MPTSDLRRPYKRPQLSDQQRRRELLLKRQEQSRDAELHARLLASTLLSLPPEQQPSESEPEPAPGSSSDYDLRDSSKLKGPEARKWFAKQLMLPECMIDVPHRLPHAWYVLPRPSGKRCFVVSSDGTTISRHRNGTILHRCPSALPSRNRDGSGPPSYSILDCIFHEGLLVYGIQGLEICRRNLDPNVCREACLYSLENKVPVIAFSKDRCLSLFDHPHVDSMHTVYHEPKAEIVPSVERLLAAADMQKLVFMDTAEGVSTALRPYWTEATGDRAIVVQIVPAMLELVPPGTSKGSGVKMLPDHLAITPKEIMAIGDGETDVEMLELAGLGICLSNGSEKTKAVANVIGSSNDEDGAADAIYRYAF